MSNEETETDLPVAASAKVYEEPSTGDLRTQFIDEDNPAAPISHEDEFVKKSDAEEAIQEARQQERREILKNIRKRINTMHEVENNREGDRAEKANRVRCELEELRDDLKQEKADVPEPPSKEDDTTTMYGSGKK